VSGTAAPIPRSGPFFSVIVPAYNAAAYLGEALASVAAQSQADFECIVIDDGSTDATAEIARSCGDQRFRVISIHHGGSPGRARNIGINAATGSYVAFLDADDLWAPEKLRRFYDHLQTSGATLVFSNGFAVDERGDRVSELLSRRMKPVFPPRDPLLVLTNILPVASVAVRRTVVLAHPFSEDPAMRGAEDYILWLKINASHELHYIGDPLLLYRCHPGQMHRGGLEQLRKCQAILSDDDVISAYGAGIVRLGLELIELRSAYRRADIGDGVRCLACLTRWLFTAQRSALLAYVRYGFVRRGWTLLRQRLSGRLVGV
jgi:glycosyltransferase involved in cell wall biosynthesis